MMEDSTFNKLLLSIIAIIIIIAGFVIYQSMPQIFQNDGKQNSCPTCPLCSSCQKCTECSKSDDTNIIVSTPQLQVPPIPVVNPARDYDYRALNDPLVPPYKRDDFQIPLPAIPTRGFPSSFKKIGILVDSESENTDPYKFMLLMGRQKYPGANFYDYYVTENKPDSALKFDLPNLHKELNTDDSVPITDLGKTYTVKVDRNLGFDYNPFIL